jgi:hypothetical protein
MHRQELFPTPRAVARRIVLRQSTPNIITLLAMAERSCRDRLRRQTLGDPRLRAIDARCRNVFGNNGTATRNSASTPRKNQNHDALLRRLGRETDRLRGSKETAIRTHP